ncbi:MAG: endoglucanase A [Clostridiaceae bacterium]|nr:endoglucanase A [Clostridiaceae bacterium]
MQTGRTSKVIPLILLIAIMLSACSIEVRNPDGKDISSTRSPEPTRQTSATSGSSDETSDPGGTETDPEHEITAFVTFSVDMTVENGEISPYIYGRNFYENETFSEHRYTFGRIGGNRWTAYNWENNASNAGSDWYFHSDGYLSSSDKPAVAVMDRVSAIFENQATALVTVPIQGYVAKDKIGIDVRATEDYLTNHFLKNVAFHPGETGDAPDITDEYVYQDEFVRYLERAFPTAERNGERIFYSLDNEPSLWAYTHEEIQLEPISYEELAEKNIEYARAIKSVVPDARIFGFVGYGYGAFIDLQGAPDSDLHGEFIDFYLKQMKRAEDEYGVRLVDVLDIHWYPEARDRSGNRITEESGDADMTRARVQAPRSLWDTGYIESSWITDVFGRPIALLPWLFEKIDQYYPETKLSISEYYFGGSHHISGAIAQADFLGIIGREGVYAAALWPPLDMKDSYTEAAFDMYLDYDGNGSSFGDISIYAQSSDWESTSVYASVFSDDPDKMVLIAINKTGEWTEATMDMKTTGARFDRVEVFRLSEAFPAPELIASLESEDENFSVELAPYSIQCLVLNR